MAQKSKPAWGAERPKDRSKSQSDGDRRSQFEVDAARIVYSPEFRRLSGVTQVISPQDDYVFHDRLTHSLKVARVAESIAQSVAFRANAANGEGFVDESVLAPHACYVAGLAHDLGHPPFGHAAEQELQLILGPTPENRNPILPDSFEGNAQSFRIVARLSFRKAYDEEHGLNLTWRSLSAISKYPWTKGKHPAQRAHLEAKWGFYDSEQDYLDEMIRQGLIPAASTDGWPRQSLEAQIMDWADDIAYAVHDIEDFFRSNRVPLHLLSSSQRLPDEASFMDFARKRVVRAKADGYAVSDEMLDKVVEGLSGQVPDSPFDGTRRAHVDLQRFGSQMITELIEGCELVKDPKGAFRLAIDPAVKLQAEFLKAFGKYFIILDPALESAQIGQRRVIRELFNSLSEWAFVVLGTGPYDELQARRLPPRLREYVELALSDPKFTGYPERSSEQKVHRAVVDYICALTDRQAGLLHQRITGDSVGRLSPFWLST